MAEFETMEAMWLRFEEAVMPPAIGEVQRREMRRAFYAGAKGFIDMIMLFLDPSVEPTDADLANMDAIYAELQAFGVAIQRGDA